MIKKVIYIFILGLFITSCKVKKTATKSSAPSMSAKKIIKKHYTNSFSKKTIKAKIKARYKNNKTTQAITMKLRVEKDKTIWMSVVVPIVNIPIAKVLITPTRVSYYEKINNTYFDGDFTLLSNFLGTDIDFDKLQNLLFGQALLNLKEQRYNAIVEKTAYVVTPKEQEALFDIFFWINTKNFTLQKQEVSQPKEQKKLSVNYLEYQHILDEVFPKKINIIATEKTKKTILDLEYRSVEFDKHLSFPFKIPSGYKEIKLK